MELLWQWRTTCPVRRIAIRFASASADGLDVSGWNKVGLDVIVCEIDAVLNVFLIFGLADLDA